MTHAIATLLPLILAAPQVEAAPASAPDAAPPALADAVKRADAAAQTLQRKLSGRLMEAMKQGGPAGAITVCRDEAAKLTEEASRDAGASVGRTSDRLRNPRNAPPPWAAPYVAAAAGKPAAEVRPVVLDMGGKVGVLRPIVVGAACTRCHGKPEAVAPDVAKLVRASYPDDRATGYAEGDHRGFVWVVVDR